MPALVVLVERAALLALLARTLRRCLAVLAGPAVTPGPLAVALRVRQARLALKAAAVAAWVALAVLAERAAIVALAALAAVAVVGLAATVVLV